MNTIRDSPVTIIAGSTGSGKSTQVPQFILDDHNQKQQYRELGITVTQPRRMAAVALANRVANERGENRAGGSVGYHIRLERQVSRMTKITYKTTGVLLRQLMSRSSSGSMTHLVVDEIHERDHLSDLLLIVIKRMLFQKQEKFKVILMSATLDSKLFSDYFNKAPVICIPGRSHPIEIVYREKLFKWPKFQNDDDESDKRAPSRGRGRKYEDESSEPVKGWGCDDRSDGWNSTRKRKNSNTGRSTKGGDGGWGDGKWNRESNDGGWGQNASKGDDWGLDSNRAKDGWDRVTESDDGWGQQDSSSKDGWGQESKWDNDSWGNDSSGKGKTVQRSSTKSNNGGEDDARESPTWKEPGNNNCWGDLQRGRGRGWEDDGKYDEEESGAVTRMKEACIDHELVAELIKHINSNHNRIDSKGGILVFVGGWHDIKSITGALKYRDSQVRGGGRHQNYDESLLHNLGLWVLPLHGSLHSDRQRLVFQRPPSGYRKVVISTSIAETSLTLTDITFVIDSGITRRKVYDHGGHSSRLDNAWISQANANQRKGRAGRVGPGVCFRLYSSTYFQNHFDNFVEAEIKRMPLANLCLQTKALFPDMPLREILREAIEPPPDEALRAGIENLLQSRILDAKERLTSLGHHLARIPLDIRNGKLLIFGLTFRCLSPCLTLAAFEGQNPFIIDDEVTNKTKKNVLAFIGPHEYSDHISLVRLFEEWRGINDGTRKLPEGSNDRRHGAELFLNDHFLSLRVLKRVSSIRRQLVRILERQGLFQRRYSDRNQNNGDENGPSWANKNSKSHFLLRGILAGSYYPYVAHICSETSRMEKCTRLHIRNFSNPTKKESEQSLRKRTRYESGVWSNSALKAEIVSTSVLDKMKQLPSKWVMFSQAQDTGFGNSGTGSIPDVRLDKCTLVAPLPLVLFCGWLGDKDRTITSFDPKRRNAVRTGSSTQRLDLVKYNLDSWIQLLMERETAELMTKLKDLVEKALQETLVGVRSSAREDDSRDDFANQIAAILEKDRFGDVYRMKIRDPTEEDRRGNQKTFISSHEIEYDRNGQKQARLERWARSGYGGRVSGKGVRSRHHRR